MVIEVRFFASLRRYTPNDPSGIISVDVADGLTVEELLHQMEVDPTPINSILINGKESALATHLADGDRLGLFPLNVNGSK
jgi:molybdopterin converting factor small subunit